MASGKVLRHVVALELTMGAGSVICFIRMPATVGAKNGSSPVVIW